MFNQSTKAPLSLALIAVAFITWGCTQSPEISAAYPSEQAKAAPKGEPKGMQDLPKEFPLALHDQTTAVQLEQVDPSERKFSLLTQAPAPVVATYYMSEFTKHGWRTSSMHTIPGGGMSFVARSNDERCKLTLTDMGRDDSWAYVDLDLNANDSASEDGEIADKM